MDQIEKFVKDSGLTISAFNVCFYDSNGTDEILDNILCGKKRANTGLFSLFEAQMQLLPRTGDYTVVLDSDMQPRCICITPHTAPPLKVWGLVVTSPQSSVNLPFQVEKALFRFSTIQF